jgi:hypothetical protein
MSNRTPRRQIEDSTEEEVLSKFVELMHNVDSLLPYLDFVRNPATVARFMREQLLERAMTYQLTPRFTATEDSSITYDQRGHKWRSKEALGRSQTDEHRKLQTTTNGGGQ